MDAAPAKGSELKLLCVADVHLGRSPTRLHPDLASRAAELGAAAAWRRAVEYAVQQRVDAVLLAGDLVDGGNDFFEAFSDLRSGAQRLMAAGIQLLAVAGNHDVEILPRLAQAVKGVRLLGRGGRWQSVDLRGAAGQLVRVVGWSFPQPVVTESPLAGGRLAQALTSTAGAPVAVLGLLHADRGGAAGRYAPVTVGELAAAPVDAWLLGHVHQPDFGTGHGLGGYLGSLTANDPGELGPRGAWLLQVAADGGIAARHVPLAPLRWERLELDVSGLPDADGLPGLIVDALEGLARRLGEEGADPVAVGCRLTLVGRSPIRAGLDSLLRSDPPSSRLMTFGQVNFFVDEVTLKVLPTIDLYDLASRDDPVGLMAARIVALGQPESALRRRLLEQARARLAEVGRHNAFVGSHQPDLDEAELAELLERAALGALDALLAQGGAP